MSKNALDRLNRLHPKIIDLSLDRVETLLARLDHPERRLPPVVHVAGTNGKGSCIAFLRAILEAAGLRVHVFTSPHLVRFHERVRLAGRTIPESDLLAVLEECEAANGGEPITFFEITTVAALLAFARVPADVVLLETGLGGRLDATNVIDRPALTVITPISLDHREYLGDSMEDIAAEKAGILKSGVPCVVAGQERKVAKVLTDKAQALEAPLIREGKDWQVRTRAGGLLYEAGGRAIELPQPALVGAHQIHNAGLAVACADHLEGFDVPPAAMALGLRTATWAARLQRIDTGPLAGRLPEGWELWLDGGHNAAAGRSLAAQARQWRDKPLHLVFGMLGTKDPGAFLKPLAARVRSLRTVTIPGESAARDAEGLARNAKALLMDAAPADSLTEALDTFVATNPTPARVLVCGSLYLAGTVLRESGITP